MGDLALCDLSLKEIPLDTATLRGPYVHTLNLSGNALVAPGNLEHFTSVTTLILDHNDLESLDGFPRMPSVTTLWLNNNRISQLVELADSLVFSFPNLVYLAFMR
jgi:Leucine-rich repeat (LRR) protein